MKYQRVGLCLGVETASSVGVLEQFVVVGVRIGMSASLSACVGVEQREADGVSSPVSVDTSELAVAPVSKVSSCGVDVPSPLLPG